MNLYRLDYEDGTAVQDWVGDVLFRHMSRARSRAIQAAAASDKAVTITRISGAGAMKATLVIMPDGTAKRPPGTVVPGVVGDCKAGTDQTCYCVNCRAARRA